MKLQFPPLSQSYPPLMQPRFGAKPNATDSAPKVTLSAMDQVELSEESLDSRLLASVTQASPQMGEVLKLAHKWANLTGSKELGPEHALLGMLDVLKESPTRSAGGGKHSRQRDDRRFALALTRALAPDQSYTPQQLVNEIGPTVLGEWGTVKAENSAASGENPIVFQPAFRDLLRLALRKSHNTNNFPEVLVREIRQQSSSASPMSPVAMFLRSLDAPASSTLVEESGSTETEESLTGVQSSELMEHLALQSPVLAKWFKPVHYRPGDKVEFNPLPFALSRGMDASLRMANAKKKPPGSNVQAGNTPVALDAFMPPSMAGKLERAQMTTLLTNAQRQLKALPKPEADEALLEASGESVALLQKFLDTPEQPEKTPAAFIQFLMAHQSEGTMPSRKAVQESQRILKEMWANSEDQTVLLQDQFVKECPALLKYGQNLVKRGMSGQLPEVLMRREATERMLSIIQSGGARTNILLNAPSGDGKTYTVMGLAQRFANNDVPKVMQGAQMVQLDLAALLAEGTYKGEFERKAKEIFSQLNQYLNQHPQQKVVVFIDEMHQMPQEEGALGLMDLMKSSGILEKKNLTFIGATTPEDWRKSPLASDQSVLGRFHAMTLPKFTNEEKLAILGRQASQLERQNKVEIPPEILEKVLREASAKWPKNALRHSIDVLNLATSVAKGTPLELASLKDQLQRKELWLQTLSEKKSMKGRFQRQLMETRQEVENLRAEVERQSASKKLDKPPLNEAEFIKEKHLRQAMAVLSGEKIEILTRDELSRLRNAKAIMAQHIVGQPEALSVIEEGLREIAIRHKTGSVRNRPIVSFLLPGPTGVGKTEVAKVIAKEFLKNKQIIRLDMGDYKEKHALHFLKGAPPGYVGYEQGGLLDKVREKPQSVVVFDEIEKAHPDIFDILLPILEEGEVINNRGEAVSFRDAVIVLTSNLNQKVLADKIVQHRQAHKEDMDPQLAASQLEQEVRQLLTANPETGKVGFKPEHLGRIDYVVPFSPLTAKSVSQIVDIRLREMNEEAFLKDQNLQVTLTESARQRLVYLTSAESASEKTLQGGARDVRSNFERHIYKKVMTELAMDPDLDELENAVIQVGYDAQQREFVLKTIPKPVNEAGLNTKNPKFSGRVLAFV